MHFYKWAQSCKKPSLFWSFHFSHYLKTASNIIPCTTRLVDVPINVHSPPKIVTYDKGIRKLVEGSRMACAHLCIIGAKITTTGVLLRKAEIKEIEGSIRACALNKEVLLCGNSFFIILPKDHDCLTHSLTKNKNATLIIPLLLNTSIIS